MLWITCGSFRLSEPMLLTDRSGILSNSVVLQLHLSWCNPAKVEEVSCECCMSTALLYVCLMVLRVMVNIYAHCYYFLFFIFKMIAT